MRQKELVSASRVAILEQLSASIGEINQPISALVLNAEAARQLLRAQPTNTGAVRRLLACIVKDGLRTGDIVRRTRALIEKAPPVSETQCPVNVDSRRRSNVSNAQIASFDDGVPKGAIDPLRTSRLAM
jgi:C4-dicarboxylate-specific signal transduction histidine kinase